MLIHMILNAHLDPVWLWPWQASLDSLLATCRSACDRLDAHPDLYFTRGEAWAYREVERLDPALFKRMQAHIASGRWEVVGGWWIQPDCNLPSGFGMERQIAFGKKYFLERFGTFPRIGYNVDSFGHAASLPGYMRAAGQDCYVMMRPGDHEMKLPSRVFRWRGYEGSPEVTTFRIARAYCTGDLSLEHVRAATKGVPAGIEHTMCFVGLGDHGGGPTEKQIAWIRENQNALPGCKMVFSSVSRFFDAIRAQSPSLPLVTGELQHHAIGCYSVYRPIKTGVRRAEHLLRQAESMLESKPPVVAHSREDLQKAWEHVCFGHFHDTFGGTCLPSAYPQIHARLGFASAVADEILQLGLRSKLTALPADPLQRVVLFNASDAPFNDLVEFEPWLERRLGSGWRLLDEQNRPVPAQVLDNEGVAWKQPRLLFKAALKPNELRTLKIQCEGPEADSVTGARVESSPETRILTTQGVACTPARLKFPGGVELAPRLDLLEDNSDTWSHGLDRYTDGPGASPVWNAAVPLDQGPLLASLLQTGTLGSSRLEAEWRVYEGEPFAELRLKVFWQERHRVLKLTLPLPGTPAVRLDGTMGGQVERPNTGRELPLRDWSLMKLADGNALGVLCPDVFALDATPQRLRLTLLRGAVMAHHEPNLGVAPRKTYSDEGWHEFRVRFYCGKLSPETLDAAALGLQRPLLAADLTRGMPTNTAV